LSVLILIAGTSPMASAGLIVDYVGGGGGGTNDQDAGSGGGRTTAVVTQTERTNAMYGERRTGRKSVRERDWRDFFIVLPHVPSP